MIKFCDSFTDPAIDELWLDIEVIVMNEMERLVPVLTSVLVCTLIWWNLF